mgnify:CR=1 FL=1
MITLGVHDSYFSTHTAPIKHLNIYPPYCTCTAMKDLKIIRVVTGLFILNTAIWLVLALISFVNMSGKQAGPSYIQVIVPLLMFGNTAMMFLAGWGIKRGWRQIYSLATVVIAVNILLTFTDQIGILDWITLVIDLVLLILLVVFRKAFPVKEVRIS